MIIWESLNKYGLMNPIPFPKIMPILIGQSKKQKANGLILKIVRQ